MTTTDLDDEPLTTARERLAELYGRPGFMIRRAHQITIAVFQAHAGECGLTNTQFGVLYVLKRYPRIDQVTLAKLLRLDRSTTGTVVATLESRGFVARDVGRADRRRRMLDIRARRCWRRCSVPPPARRARSSPPSTRRSGRSSSACWRGSSPISRRTTGRCPETQSRVRR